MPKSDRGEYNAYMREYMARRYSRRMEDVKLRLGGACMYCGETTNLQIDHVKRDGKRFTVGRKLAGISEEKLSEEIAKCQLLCTDCHARKTVEERGQQLARGRHGTISTYRYCKCPECREAKSQCNREYRLRMKVGAPNG